MNIDTSDQDLVQSILNGDRNAVNQLVVRHKKYAFTLANNILNNVEDAEEAAHDAFMKALKSLNSYRSDAKFTTWFYRIVVNTAISRKRKMKLYHEDIDEVKNQGQFAVLERSHLSDQDRSEYVKQALAEMNEVDATLITLYYFKDMNLEEMEEITGFDKKNAKVKLFRARKKLGVLLTKLLKEETQELL